MTRTEYQKIITINPLVKNGEPCIRDLPITVAEIKSLVLKATPLDLILVEYPQLTLEDLKACLDYLAAQPFGKYFN